MLEKVQERLKTAIKAVADMSKDPVEARHMFLISVVLELSGFIEGYIEGKEKDGKA